MRRPRRRSLSSCSTAPGATPTTTFARACRRRRWPGWVAAARSCWRLASWSRRTDHRPPWLGGTAPSQRAAGAAAPRVTRAQAVTAAPPSRALRCSTRCWTRWARQRRAALSHRCAASCSRATRRAARLCSATPSSRACRRARSHLPCGTSPPTRPRTPTSGPSGGAAAGSRCPTRRRECAAPTTTAGTGGSRRGCRRLQRLRAARAPLSPASRLGTSSTCKAATTRATATRRPPAAAASRTGSRRRARMSSWAASG
mmetsp:Transcript_33698/g.105765  ORF Transcript_33698/g.105765 Transcript_33698/m.105765 type:complete len:257 (+) Transcript_33698:1442-2212(+)